MITFSKVGKFGRFGNQLWQIASTIGIAIKNNHNFVFDNWPYQEYFKNPLPYGQLINPKIYTEVHYGFSDINFDNKFDYDLYGYFQSYKYFRHCEELIRFYFTPIIDFPDEDFIAVHVRHGDYLQQQHIHIVLSVEYYKKAMDKFTGKKFRFFSDDLDWCKTNFPGHEYADLDEPIYEFFFMAKHSGFIISPSSYSWWAAYLAKDKPVVAPSIWTRNEPAETINDRIPEGWIKEEVEIENENKS